MVPWHIILHFHRMHVIYISPNSMERIPHNQRNGSRALILASLPPGLDLVIFRLGFWDWGCNLAPSPTTNHTKIPPPWTPTPALPSLASAPLTPPLLLHRCMLCLLGEGREFDVRIVVLYAGSGRGRGEGEGGEDKKDIVGIYVEGGWSILCLSLLVNTSTS